MALSSIITAKPPSSYRNDLTVAIGYKFTTNRSVTVTGLGRAVLTIFSQSHTVRLWSSAYSLLASVSVSTSSPRLGDFAYELLGSPVTIASGGTFYLASSEANGGDNWANTQSIAGLYDTGAITVAGSCYSSDLNPIGPPNSGNVQTGQFAYGWSTLIEGSAFSPTQRRKTAQNSIRSTF